MLTMVGQRDPLPKERTEQITETFYQEGFAILPEVLSPDEVNDLKFRIDRAFSDPGLEASHNRYSDYIMCRMFELDPLFQDLLTREPIIGLAEAVLGSDCHLVAQNVVRNKPGQAIDDYHADDLVILPVSEGMRRHDPRLRMPVFMLTFQIPLTDIPSDEYGPTQYIPTSHYAGRQPDDTKNPTFENQKPVSIHCKAGDSYLHNGQCWHRGAPNNSSRTRYLLQLSFGARWVAQRFFPFLNYRVPRHVLEHAAGDERMLRVLGKHPKGAYG